MTEAAEFVPIRFHTSLRLEGYLMKDRRDVLGIDVLRIFAAIAVMLFHFGFKAFSEDSGVVPHFLDRPVELSSLWMVSWWGWIGVQLFFVISGLVIAFSVARPGTSAPKFLKSRFLRLVPAVLIATSFALLVEITFFDRDMGNAAVLWLRTVVFFPFPNWIMGQFWTIGIEVSFYIGMLALIYAGKTHHLTKFGLALILISGLYWVLRTAAGGTASFDRVAQLLLVQHGMYFGIGILISNWASDNRSRFDLPFIGLGLVFSAFQIRLSTLWEAGSFGLFAAWPVAFAIFVAFVFLVMFALQINDWLLERVGDYKGWFRTAGMMTYPLYLLHNHVGKPLLVWLLQANFPDWLAIFGACAGALFMSFLVAVWLEPIVRQALRGLLEKPRQTPWRFFER